MLFNLAVSIVAAAIGCIANAAIYDPAQAETSLFLSCQTFCDIDTFETRAFTGPTAGFVVTKTINHPKSRAVGFVGYLPSDTSIYIAIRGSSSTNNWISDMEVSKVNYTSFPECDCQVAKGFYNAEQSIIAELFAEVQALRLKLPGYLVKVTGHSYGAALSQLISMDIIQRGIPCSVYNFGQPRTGDEKYSAFVGQQELLSTFRVVHNRDIVPHWPFAGDTLGYHHVCTEEFEDEDGSVKTCDSSCEDPSCSDQYQPHEWRPEEHMTYLGHPISCECI